MAGLSVGSAVVGRGSARIRRPIAAYGYFELGVGLFLVLTPALYRLLDGPSRWPSRGPGPGTGPR